jgi:hypothetical protein
VFAPVSWAVGFLRAPLDLAAHGLLAWRREIYGSAESISLSGGLEDNVFSLEPLTGGVRPRELVVSTANPEWTALFDCGVQGGDPTTTIGYLARTLKVQGVVVVAIRDVPATAGHPQQFGARQLEMFAPIATEFLNYVRIISVVQDGGRWRFDADGTVQDFEDVEAYGRRRIAERFTDTMLADYAAALGLRPFDNEFFPGPSVLVRNPAVPPPGAHVLTLRDAQRRTGIVSPQ